MYPRKEPGCATPSSISFSKCFFLPFLRVGEMLTLPTDRFRYMHTGYENEYDFLRFSELHMRKPESRMRVALAQANRETALFVLYLKIFHELRVAILFREQEK